MDRLTEYHNGIAVIKDKSMMKEAMAKLAEFEDLEANRRILKLPFGPRDTMWRVYGDWTECQFGKTLKKCGFRLCSLVGDGFLRCDSMPVKRIKPVTFDDVFDIVDVMEGRTIGMSLFYTKEDAEKALEEGRVTIC